VTRTLNKLMEGELLASAPSGDDRRVRRVDLTERGRQLVERSKRELWPVIEAAVADACAELAGPLLEQLAALEDALTTAPLAARAARAAEGGPDASA
jgi:DNA-binding MarR family transcriptional regulator